MKKRILILMTAAALAAGSTGCSRLAEVKDVITKSREADKGEAGEETESPVFDGEEGEVQEMCEAFFDAYTSLDGEEVGRLIHYGDTMTFSELQAALSEGIEVEIRSVSVDGEDAEAEAEITNVDMAAIIESLSEDISSKEEATEAMIEAIRDKDAPKAVFEMTLLFTKVEDRWLIEVTPELSDALVGGYQSFLNKLLEEMVE